jgi:uncharacterized protein (UPF0147 family)
VVVIFSSLAGSVSFLSFFSKSWIFVSTVDSSVLSTMGRVASVVVSPSFTMITRFWHLAHHSSPVLSLNKGEAQAGHENSVSVTPCLRRLAIVCRVFASFFVNWVASIKKPISVVVYLNIALRLEFWGLCPVVGKKKLKEYEDRIEQALAVLGLVSEDTTTPRNIRRTAKESIDALQVTADSPAVRASNAVSKLDEILQDPNMPPYTRVKLWNVMSLLEAIKD